MAWDAMFWMQMVTITEMRYGMDETAHWPLFGVQMVTGTQHWDAGRDN